MFNAAVSVFQYGALHVRPGYHEEYENSPERYKGRSMLVSTHMYCYE